MTTTNTKENTRKGSKVWNVVMVCLLGILIGMACLLHELYLTGTYEIYDIKVISKTEVELTEELHLGSEKYQHKGNITMKYNPESCEWSMYEGDDHFIRSAYVKDGEDRLCIQDFLFIIVPDLLIIDEGDVTYLRWEEEDFSSHDNFVVKGRKIYLHSKLVADIDKRGEKIRVRREMNESFSKETLMLYLLFRTDNVELSL